jgi:predicted Zn-dependent protease
MKYRIIVLMLLSLPVFSCTTVPITGRQQLSLIPSGSMLSLSSREYDSFLKTNKLSTDRQKAEMVQRVGERISSAVARFLALAGESGRLKDYHWEFNLVEDPQVNAWCMPGGKVVFYTGILPFTKDETGMAVVMGHEIAHAVAGHGAERMSQELLVNMGGVALSEALATKPAETSQLWLMAFGVGARYGAVLPYSRLHEKEADRLGLIFMAMAGYDPAKAVEFWERMAAAGGKKPPELLSTHPSDATRIAEIRKYLPEALRYQGK